jgi:hypothetical protein
MEQTIDAIQDRLAPERLTEQAVDAATDVTVQARDAAKDVAKFAIDEAKSAVRELADQARGAVRDSTVGRMEHLSASARGTAMEVQGDMLTVIRQNPVPAALAAIGIGWLWMSRSNAPSEPTRGYGYGPYGYESGWRTGAMGAPSSQSHGVAGQVQQMAGQAFGQVQDLAGQAEQMAGQTFGGAQDAAGHMQHQARSVVQEMAADPVALGAIGLAFGAVAGLLLPETTPETKVFGEARAQVADRVQEVAGQAVDTVQRIAADAAQTAMHEARGAMDQAATSTDAAGS